jgi:hypothetical protein
MKKLSILIIMVLGLSIFSCTREANIASHNLSKAAEQFKIYRRVVFYNGITDKYILSVEGFCSIDEVGKKLTVTMKTGHQQYYKHYLGLSDNVTYFVEQINAAGIDPHHYKIILKPSSIIPSISIK